MTAVPPLYRMLAPAERLRRLAVQQERGEKVTRDMVATALEDLVNATEDARMCGEIARNLDRAVEEG